MKFKLGLCQMAGTLDKEETRAIAEKFVREAAENGAQVVALPEMWDCPYSNDYFRDYAEPADGPTVEFMSRLADELDIYLIGGSISELDGDKVYNTSFSFDRSGKLIGRHRKVHLFDVTIPGMRFHESDSFSPGREITVFDTEYGKMGAAICFDVRFPELFRAMAVRGAKVIFLPAQFNSAKSEAAKAFGIDDIFIEKYIERLVIDPFGITLASADETEQILFADLDLGRIDEVRGQLPTFLHLRRDVYAVAE